MIQVLVHLEGLCTLIDKTSYQIGLEVPVELGDRLLYRPSYTIHLCLGCALRKLQVFASWSRTSPVARDHPNPQIWHWFQLFVGRLIHRLVATVSDHHHLLGIPHLVTLMMSFGHFVCALGFLRWDVLHAAVCPDTSWWLPSWSRCALEVLEDPVYDMAACSDPAKIGSKLNYYF